MIDALAQAAGVLDEPRYLQAAATAADFILDKLRRADGRLLHTWRHGQATLDAYLDDYACLANALVSLYEATFDERWIDEACELADLTARAVRRSRAGGLLLHGQRSRDPDRPAKGPVRQRHAQRQFDGRHGPGAARQS